METPLGISVAWSPGNYMLYKLGLGFGGGGSITTGVTNVAPAHDLFIGTDFEGQSYNGMYFGGGAP